MTFPFSKRAAPRRAMHARALLSESVDGLIIIDGKACLNFASNDYLGLSQHPDVLQSYVEGLAQYGAGNFAVNTTGGYVSAQKHLHDQLCELLNKEAVLLFSDETIANQAICLALSEQATQTQSIFKAKQDEDEITTATKDAGKVMLCDQYLPISFKHAASHYSVRLKCYRHNDIEDVRIQLAQCKYDTLIVTQSVFANRGDLAKLHDLQALIGDANHFLMVDDSHGFGVLGKNGMGICEYLDVDPHNIDVLTASLGNAVGINGCFVAGDHVFIDHLISQTQQSLNNKNVAPAQAVAISKSLELIQSGQQRDALKTNIQIFKQLALEHALPVLHDAEHADSAIVCLATKDAQSCIDTANALMELGIYLPVIFSRPAAVDETSLSIRLSAQHSTTDIQALIDALCITRERLAWQ